MTLGRKFWSNVDIGGEEDCWEWLGACSEKGYGICSKYGGTRLAHRVSWMEANGQIPYSMLVCHHCDNPPCVNPNHLFLGTMKDNLDDCIAKNRHPFLDSTKAGSPGFRCSEEHIRCLRYQLDNPDSPAGLGAGWIGLIST